MKKNPLSWTHELARGHWAQKDVQIKYPNNIPTRNNLLESIVGASEKIRVKKSALVKALEGKQPHEIFEYFANQETKEIILKEESTCV